MRPTYRRLRTYEAVVCRFLKTAANNDSGQELVEFALVGTVLLTLVLGIIWMGRGYNVYETITRAAREGATYAVLPNAASLGNVYPDTYLDNSCLTNPTTVFTTTVSPALLASSMDPTKVSNYCQQAQWLAGTSPQQCGVVISFAYPVQLTIPFTPLNASTINIHTQVQMRMENVSVDSTGTTTCP